MARKPSNKTHRQKPLEGLNLTPFIDMITCLMFFLLMFAAAITVSLIDAPLPKVASTAEEVKQAKDKDNKLEITLTMSPKGFVVRSDVAGEHSFPAVGGKLPYDELHKYLVGLHQKKPNSREITLMASDDTPYDVMIEAMDASRELVKGDAGFQAVPPEIAVKPEKEQFNRLFPDVSIGGV